jgi:hypothetical protein
VHSVNLFDGNKLGLEQPGLHISGVAADGPRPDLVLSNRIASGPRHRGCPL